MNKIAVGNRYGKLLTIRKTTVRMGTNYKWEFKCDCGNTVLRLFRNARLTGHCGCERGPKIARARYKHGQCGTPAYKAWSHMLQRCTNPVVKDYDYYGGRGIIVCERWHDFRNFLADMGQPPEGRSIDRIDTNGNYEPGNCRWATLIEQRNNQRNNHVLHLPDGDMTIAQAARHYGLRYTTLYTRIQSGMDPLTACTKPVMAEAI